jgi:hypothetical protein
MRQEIELKIAENLGYQERLQNQLYGGHNQEHAEIINRDLAKAKTDLISLRLELSLLDLPTLTDIGTKKNNSSSLHRTLSIEANTPGDLQLQCQATSSIMIERLKKQLDRGKVSDKNYDIRVRAINSRLKFFTATTVHEFSQQVEATVKSSSGLGK